MKKDYLWDKTGNDSEIEKLENALQAFRYRETAPPLLPAEILLFRKEPSHKIFRFAKLAMAACIAFAVIALGVWQQISSNKTEINKDLAEAVESQKDVAIPNVVSVTDPTVKGNLIAKKFENPKQSSERRINPIYKVVSAGIRQKQTKIENIKYTKPNVVLTKEEHYAYEQLMLALSITSSKLKLVKDKVQGIENQTVASENGR